MSFSATKHPVSNRGVAPDEFLWAIIDWAKSAPMELFATNNVVDDIYARIRPNLGPWESNEHRRAAMLEAMRVHAGFESSWNWREGVDVTNHTSMTHLDGQEAGIFQVSYDSSFIANNAMQPYLITHGIGNAQTFISSMKSDTPSGHELAIDYYAHLVRINVKWAGPIARNEINPWLRRDAVTEFQELLA